MKQAFGVGVAALVLLAPCAAVAADLAVKAPAPPMTPIAAVFNWTGIYLGINGGYGWGQSDPLSVIDSRFDRNAFSTSGGVVGGTMGAQIQQGHVVLGLEGDLDWADIRGSGITTPTIAGVAQGITLNTTTKIDGFGTVRARAGMAMDNWLFFVTGGGAVMHETANGSSIAGAACGTPGILASCSGSAWRPGVTGGLGVEWGITPAWSAKAEYLYTVAVGSGVTEDHLNMVRLGINYRFGQ